MSAMDINILIAKELGWISDGQYWFSAKQIQKAKEICVEAVGSDEYWRSYVNKTFSVPDYSNSHDACCEFLESLTESERMLYVRTLLEIIHPELTEVIFGLWEGYGWNLLEVRPKQKCEAYLKVRGKYVIYEN